jgi:hypothetical protein
MELALFLVRSWGLLLALVCLGLLFHKKTFLTVLKRIHPDVLLLLGILLLSIGVAQVVGFESLSFSWMGLLTLLGWGVLLKGAMMLFVPGYTERFIKLAVKDNWYTGSLIVGLLLGAYFLYVGYIVY